TLAAYYGEAGKISRGEAEHRAAEALDMVGLPYDRAAGVSGLGAAALKKLELARALATKPRLLLADESLGGLDRAEMERAADLLGDIRSRIGITIVWVEHIMGVLMRVVGRVIVLDHGEKIFDGLPAEAARNARVAKVYVGRRDGRRHPPQRRRQAHLDASHSRARRSVCRRRQPGWAINCRCPCAPHR